MITLPHASESRSTKKALVMVTFYEAPAHGHSLQSSERVHPQARQWVSTKAAELVLCLERVEGSSTVDSVWDLRPIPTAT